AILSRRCDVFMSISVGHCPKKSNNGCTTPWQTSYRNEMAFIDMNFRSSASTKRTAPPDLQPIVTDLGWPHVRNARSEKGQKSWLAKISTTRLPFLDISALSYGLSKLRTNAWSCWSYRDEETSLT